MNWSDDETNIMTQPLRDMPESDSEEDEYIQHIITKVPQYNTIDISNDKKKKKIKEKKQNKNILTDMFKKPENNIRKFNPRLPPPDKYKK
jgi:hypothetical protein